MDPAAQAPAEGPAGGGVKARLRKALKLVRERRFDQLTRYFFEFVPRGVLHADLLYITELNEPNRRVRRPRQITVREVETGDVDGLGRVFGREPMELEDRLRAGHRGFVCEAHGRIVAMSWLNLGAIHPEPEKFCQFVVPSDAAWAYDLWILPEWRLRGAMVAMVYHTIEEVRAAGRRRLCGYASWHNRDSLQAHVSFGHQIIGQVLLVNLLGLRFFRSRGLGTTAGAATTTLGFRSTPSIDLVSSEGHPVGGKE